MLLTLLTSYLTRDYVLSVADRRVTRTDGVVLDDGRNKAVQCGSSFAFTYTGLATLAGEPTDVWLAKILARAFFTTDPFTFLASAAQAAIFPLRIPDAWKRQAFFGVGWAMTDSDQLNPVAAVVSNSLGMDWQWTTVSSFTPDLIAIPTECWWFLPRPLGARVSDAEFRALARTVRRCRQHRVSALGMAAVLARFIRSVAAREPSVGRTLVAVIVPRPPAVESAVFFSAPIEDNAPDLSGPACFVMSEGQGAFRWTLPAFVGNGVAFCNTVFEPNHDGWELRTAIWGRPPSGRAAFAVRAGDELHFIAVGPDGLPFQGIEKLPLTRR